MTDTEPALRDLRFAVVDLETSGLEATKDQILQIAVVTADCTGAVTDEWCTYVKPPRWPFASVGPREVHGISRRMLREAPNTATALAALAERLDGAVFVAHNVDFDLGFVRHHAAAHGVAVPEVPVVCTLTLSRSLDPAAKQSHRLSDVCRRYGVELERAHDALADARAAAALLPHLIAAVGIDDAAELLRLGMPVSQRRRNPSAPQDSE